MSQNQYQDLTVVLKRTIGEPGSKKQKRFLSTLDRSLKVSAIGVSLNGSEIKVKITLGKIVGGVTAPIVSKPHDFFMPIFNPLLPPDLASLLTKNNLTFKFVAAEPKAEIMDGYQHRRRRNPFDSRMNRGGRSRGRYDGANVSGPR